MRIGIDIDDTITNTTYDTDICALEYDESLKIDKSKYNFDERYHWNNMKCDDFWCKYVDRVMRNTSLREKSNYFINKLYDEGNTIYFITSRNNLYSPNVINITETYLKKHHIKYDKLITSAEYKGETCKKYEIDLMIDDSPYQAKDLEKYGINYILVSNDYNKDIDCKKFLNWEEIYEYINRR